MQITFDPHNAQECDETLGFIAQAQPCVVKMWLIDYNESQDADTAQPETAETARADGLTVTDGPTPPFDPSQMTPLAADLAVIAQILKK